MKMKKLRVCMNPDCENKENTVLCWKTLCAYCGEYLHTKKVTNYVNPAKDDDYMKKHWANIGADKRYR